MRRLKRWLWEHFLPVWAKQTLLAENRNLIRECEKLHRQLEEKNAYIEGLENGIRAQRRIVINTGEARK